MNDTVRIALVLSASQKGRMLQQRLAEIDQLVLAGSFDNVQSAQRELADLQPAVLLVDASLPEDDLLGFVRHVADNAFDTQSLLLLGELFAHDKVLRAVEAGALGYVHEDATSAALASAFRQARTGLG